MLERRGESVGRINSVMVWVCLMNTLGFVYGFTEDYIMGKDEMGRRWGDEGGGGG